MRFASLLCLLALSPLTWGQPNELLPNATYVKKGTRTATVQATLETNGVPTLAGTWYFAGPFDNQDRTGHDFEFPPEKGVDLKANYVGKNGEKFGWQEYKGFRFGEVLDLKSLFPRAKTNAVVYLYHEFESKLGVRVPLSLGSDDTLSLWFNGAKLVHEDHERACEPDQMGTLLKVKPGKNTLLLKICQYGGEWQVYVQPEMPDAFPEAVHKAYAKDFPKQKKNKAAPEDLAAEGKHYRISTIPLPPDCVLEVGGLGFRPDGKLLACTRRGEVYLIHNPTAKNPADVKFSLFASGLHEPLGMFVESNNSVVIVQRPELTKLSDGNGDGVADRFTTLCDAWGVSGDYHEFAFGPARDKEGNFFITLNVGFGGGHQAKSPWRGWCCKITPDGKLEPYAYGLRSPNGVNFSPEGDLFYCDNQGEWVATNKMHQIRKGKFFGHQASLKWLPQSPFNANPAKVLSGMMYDGGKGPKFDSPRGYPELDPPAIWFPYGRMGQSVTEPVWDTTGGKFGPFAGQCFVGDQTRSNVMRVALEKVNDTYQGACFPFVNGLQCGVNRIAFAPDGSLFAGQTNRGWGSVGGKPFGLQRVEFTGNVPFEVHHVNLTATGFDFHFTKPIAEGTKADAVFLKSFTYAYLSQYGCPEMDIQAEAISSMKRSADGKVLSMSVAGLKKGRVYEFKLAGVNSADGVPLLHPDAYYTLNELVK